MARDEYQAETIGQFVESADDGDLLAVMGAGGHDHGPVADGGAEAGEGGGVMRRGLAGEFEVHMAVDPGAEAVQPGGRGLVLRQDAVEGGQDPADRAGEAPPALDGLFGDAGTGEDQFHAATPGLEDQIGPEFALDEDGEGRLPVIEEGGHRARRIDRRELVDDTGRQAAGHELGRGQGARGDEYGQVRPLAANPFDHGQERQGLADTDAVQPDQITGGPGDGGQAQPFVDADGVFLALSGAGVEQAGGQRLQQPGQKPVDDQGGAHVKSARGR